MARAKRTDRTEARRRHRAEQVTVTGDVDDTTSAADGKRPAQATKATGSAPPPRPSFIAAFRGAFRSVQLKPDLLALPKILTHWGLLAALAATVVSTAVFVITTSDFAAGLDLTLSDPAAGQPIGAVSNVSYIAVSLFVAPPPAAGAFLVGFTAPRASWLGGLIYGIVAAACYTVVLLSPTGRLFIGANDPQPYVVNAWIVAPLGASLFASASAWYKRFLNLANPNRGRPPAKPAPKGRGNARPNSRVTG